MKGDFAGGKLPSGDFGENAAWWWIMILAMKQRWSGFLGQETEIHKWETALG
jgi:hypothetical protein